MLGYYTQLGCSRLEKRNNLDSIGIRNASCRTKDRKDLLREWVEVNSSHIQNLGSIHINRTWMSINMCSVCVMSIIISDTTASARFLANWILLPRWNSWWLFFSMVSLTTALFFYYYTISVDTCIVISFPAIVSILRQCVGFLLLKGCISLKKGLSCVPPLEREHKPFQKKVYCTYMLKAARVW
mgnify:CR=1 FL=1